MVFSLVEVEGILAKMGLGTGESGAIFIIQHPLKIVIQFPKLLHKIVNGIPKWSDFLPFGLDGFQIILHNVLAVGTKMPWYEVEGV
jgi:hypothetical protein